MIAGTQLLSDLAEPDLAWLFSVGQEHQVIANTAITIEDEHLEDLVFVLHGLLGVELEALPDQRIATLGPGELIGELSFLEGSPASATVRAVENSLLLKVSFEALEARLAEDTDFAARLYRSFARTAARRLRAREAFYGQQLHQREQAEQSDGIEQRIETLLEEYKRLLQEADRAAAKEGGVVPDDLAREIRGGFATFVIALNAAIGDQSGLTELVRERLGARVQRDVLPYLLMTKTSERLYSKPRGYAGDFLSIDWIYADVAQGEGRLGKLLDRCFLDEPAARAVRNRRDLLKGKIMDVLERNPERPVKITVMACGPAREVFDVFELLPDPARLEVELIDIDAEALAQVAAEAKERGLDARIRTHQANLVYLALGRDSLDISDQDLVYSIGLVDYFNDKLTTKLMSYGHSLLRSGGQLVLGNFHPSNPDKALMDYVLDWRLIHRDEADMNRLSEASAFGQPCSELQLEEAGVNLFATSVRT